MTQAGDDREDTDRMTLSVREPIVEDSRADILRAAAVCFMEKGYTAASIDDVARRVGATKGRIYHHFPSKAHLFAEVFRFGMDRIFIVTDPHRNTPGRAVDRWKKLAFVHTRTMTNSKALARVVWEGVEMHLRGATTPEQRAVLDDLVTYRNSYSDVFRQTIAQARDEGDFTFDDLGIANQVMFMALNSPIFWYTPRPSDPADHIDNIAKQVVAFAYRGLGGRGEP
ncbi:MAG TPA: TetR/AcrR family transcriptional regulator [Rhizobiaceae bacterium]|nr:TetR/AcrR family transcriptional regulator [Rhizobiaceae bacterium]